MQKKSTRCTQKRAKYGPSSWPTWRHLGSNLAHLGAKMRPNRHPNGAPDASQIASWAILAPRGSPMSSKVPLESQFSLIFLQFWTRLGHYLEVCWGASWRQDGPSCGQDGAKLPNLAPRWAQDGHLRFQNGQLKTISGGILPTFKDIGCEKPDSRKPQKTLGFYRFFMVWGALGGHVASSWRHVGLCWASWAPSWSNLATR